MFDRVCQTLLTHDTRCMLDCKTVGFFLKISKETGKAWRKSLTRAKRASLTRKACEAREKSVSPQSRSLFSVLFETFCLTARAYLNRQKYGLFCSLGACSNIDIWNKKK